MTHISRTNSPDEHHARGAITPVVRAAIHMGYILGGLAGVSTETWEAQRASILTDFAAELNEAIAHLSMTPLLVGDNPFIGTQATVALTFVHQQCNDAMGLTVDDLRDLFQTATNLAHNLAYASQLIDRDAFGIQDATAGRAL
jgi:hypothetical protein